MSNNQPNPRRVNSEDSNSEKIMAASAEDEIINYDDVEEYTEEERDAFRRQSQRAKEFLARVEKAEEDAKQRKIDLTKKFAELRRQKAEEKLQTQRRNDLDLLISSFQTDIDERHLTEAMVESTFISCDCDCNVAHMLLGQMLEMEREHAERERQAALAERQATIDRFHSMREGLGRPDMTKEECQELLEANDWDLTKTIVSLYGT